jgi:hypothetical protein
MHCKGNYVKRQWPQSPHYLELVQYGARDSLYLHGGISTTVVECPRRFLKYA